MVIRVLRKLRHTWTPLRRSPCNQKAVLLAVLDRVPASGDSQEMHSPQRKYLGAAL